MKKIVDGWKNAIQTDEKIEAIAKERLSVCDKCEHKLNVLGADVCGLCFCPLFAKSRSPESNCPNNRW